MLQELNLSKEVIGNMKRQNNMPSADKLAKIAQYLEVSTEYLLDLTDDPTPPKKELTLDEQVAAEYYKLSADEREQLKEYMEFLKIKKARQAKSASGRIEVSSGLQPE